jgi:hypothetical protein
MPTNPFMGGNVIPYIPAKVQPTQQRERVHFFNIAKNFANQSATTVGLTWKIGTQVPRATIRSGATRMVSIAQITWSMNAPTTSSVAK